jgi:hypothetical protein
MSEAPHAFVVRSLVAEDASDLTACVVECYGTTYPKRVLYDIEALRESIRNETYSGIVAVAPSNSMLVGHIGWVRHALTAATVEAGATMVRPACRGQGLLKELGSGLHAELKRSGFSGYVHFPTTAHTVMQRASVSSGGAETGLLLGYLPVELDVAGFGGPRPRRLAVTAAYQPLGEPPSCIVGVASDSDAMWLAEVASKLGLRRTITVTGDQPTLAASQITSSYTASRDLLSITVIDIGADLAGAIDIVAMEHPSLLIHVDLDATSRAASWACRHLASNGFVFGAWLPGWYGYGSDALRLQRISDLDVVDLQPELLTPEARAMLQRITGELRANSQHR